MALNLDDALKFVLERVKVAVFSPIVISMQVNLVVVV